MSDAPVLDEILRRIPEEQRDLSGSVLYSGREAFTRTSRLYLLGINPGGDPDAEVETVQEQAARVLRHEHGTWSAYRDDSWGPGADPGTWGMQPRVLHLLRELALDPGHVPASNMVFARSRREGNVASRQMRAWAEACWPFHEQVINRLGVRVIVCFGGTVAGFVREKLDAHEQADSFVEANRRRWTSRSFRNDDGMTVIQASHPSVADWRNPAADITTLVSRALLE